MLQETSISDDACKIKLRSFFLIIPPVTFFLSPRMKSERSLINSHKTILKALRIFGSLSIVMRTFRHMLLWGGEQSLWLCIL